MIVEVAERHIALGRPYDVDGCPVALAVRESLGAERVVVMRRIAVSLNARVRHYRRTRAVDRFVRAVGAGRSVRPFRFRLLDAWPSP